MHTLELLKTRLWLRATVHIQSWVNKLLGRYIKEQPRTARSLSHWITVRH